MLAQLALLWMLYQYLPVCRSACSVIFACDNSAVEAVHHKGLARAHLLGKVLLSMLQLQQKSRIQVCTQHIPGHRNVLADAISRNLGHLMQDLSQSEKVSIPWEELLSLVKEAFGCVGGT